MFIRNLLETLRTTIYNIKHLRNAKLHFEPKHLKKHNYPTQIWTFAKHRNFMFAFMVLMISYLIKQYL